MTIFNKTFDIFEKSRLLINTINDFILFRYFKMFCVKKIIRERKNIKTQIIIIKNKKSMILKINAIVFFFN